MARIHLTREMAQAETHLPFYGREAPGQMLSLNTYAWSAAYPSCLHKL